MSELKHTQLHLADDRYLDMFQSGPQDGRVLLFHHGTPGSGLQFRVMADAAHRLGLQFVTTSRAGYGDSTRCPGRTVADVVADTAAVLDAAGADQCLVAGWSGGGPHALACGALLAERVAAALVIAGVGPYDADGLDFLAGMGEDNVVEFNHALNGEATLRPYLEKARAHMLQATPAGMIVEMRSLLPPIDQAAFTDEFGTDLAANMQEGLRIGVDGWLDDDLAFTQQWGFELGDVAVPIVLWQGSEDLMVPAGHGRWLSSRIPGIAAHIEEGEGHLSITLGSIDRMLSELVAVS